jgi:hypothetical protein
VSEPDFESQLSALYRVTPRQADDDAFVAQIDAALDAHLRRRRWILTLLGMAGGGITFAAFARLEASVLLQRFFASTFDVLVGLTSMSPISMTPISMTWGVVATGAVIALLLLPAFMRTVIDPK